MIFVTVGTHPQQFNRLLMELDRLVEGKMIKEEVFAQTGYSTYKPKNFPSKDFIDDREYAENMRKASLVISHGGAGAIINSLKNKKKLIVVPRLERFGEHTNDHQIDLARAMEKAGKVIGVYEISYLADAVKRSKYFAPKKSNEKTRIIKAIEDFLGVE